jgi:hypothetical protein
MQAASVSCCQHLLVLRDEHQLQSGLLSTL